MLLSRKRRKARKLFLRKRSMQKLPLMMRRRIRKLLRSRRKLPPITMTRARKARNLLLLMARRKKLC